MLQITDVNVQSSKLYHYVNTCESKIILKGFQIELLD